MHTINDSEHGTCNQNQWCKTMAEVLLYQDLGYWRWHPRVGFNLIWLSPT